MSKIVFIIFMFCYIFCASAKAYVVQDYSEAVSFDNYIPYKKADSKRDARKKDNQINTNDNDDNIDREAIAIKMFPSKRKTRVYR